MSFVDWRNISPRRLLLLAALLHFILVLVISAIGRWQLLPQTIDNHGVGIAFALDSASYREEAVHMANLMRDGNFRSWFEYDMPLATFHARIYSVCFVALGPLFGEGILAIEPINLLYYLSILVLVYKIGASVFSSNVGRIAAVVVGLWPSLLVFSTQLLRDHLFISSFLLLLFSLITFIKNPISLRTTIINVGAAYIALALILLVRSTMWEIVTITVFVTALFSIVSQLNTRQLNVRQTVSILLICVAVLLLPRILPGRRVSDRANRALSRQSSPAVANNLSTASRIARQIGWARQQFVTRYTTAGSNLDTETEIRTVADVVRYLPRALAIGMFAPFPNMWFSAGSKVGLSGRLWIGAEMLVLYAGLFLAGVTVIRERRKTAVWFLVATSVSACVVLALVVVNVGALYRLRYPYFIPIVLLAVKSGYDFIAPAQKQKQSDLLYEASFTQ